MISATTIKKLNAVSTAISLMEDSGVSASHFEINDIPDEELIKIAEDRKSKITLPSALNNYYYTVIQKGVHILKIRGVRKEEIIKN